MLHDAFERQKDKDSMQLSSAYKHHLAKAARLATAGAMLVTSLGAAVISPALAQTTSNSTTITSSQPGLTNNQYVVSFNPAAATITAIKDVTLKFCVEPGTYTDTCTAPAGMGFTTTSASAAGFGTSGGATTGTFSAAANVVTFVVTTPGANEVASNAHVLTFPGFTNPTSAGTYYTRVRTWSNDPPTTVIDAGTSAFAIVSPVTVSGTVLENLTFTVAAVTSGACGAGGDTVTATAATATTVPFGNLNSGTPKIGCHNVKTATNASSGYSTYVHEVNATGAAPAGAMCRQTATNCTTSGAQSAVSANDYIADAGLNGTAAAWTAGTTFGLGVGSVGAEAEPSFTAATYKTLLVIAGVKVATKASSTAGVNTAVAYKIDIPANQTAGVYQNQLEYISTPIY
jgi:hypothetical protein